MRKQQQKKQKQKLSRRKTREFSGDRRVSRNPRETTATARPALSPRHPAPSGYLQREKRQKL